MRCRLQSDVEDAIRAADGIALARAVRLVAGRLDLDAVLDIGAVECHRKSARFPLPRLAAIEVRKIGPKMDDGHNDELFDIAPRDRVAYASRNVQLAVEGDDVLPAVGGQRLLHVRETLDAEAVVDGIVGRPIPLEDPLLVRGVRDLELHDAVHVRREVANAAPAFD